MTKCPHCQSTNIRYRYYSSSSWTSTWKCDICKDEIYSGQNYYHCRPCCDRGGSSHEPEVKRCSGMYCTYCVNKKNDAWEKEKRDLQKKADDAQRALQDEKTRIKEIADERKETAKVTLQKSNTFINTCENTVAQLQAFDNDSKEQEPDIPSAEALNQMANDCTKFIQQSQAAVAAVQESAKSTFTEVSSMKTVATETEVEEVMNKITVQQDVIIKHQKNIRENITKTNEQEIKVVQQVNIVNNEIIIAKQNENNLHGVDGEIAALRRDLQNVSGAEINANPEAVKKMNRTYDKLLQFMLGKHAENKQKIAELKDSKERIGKIRAKLMSTQSQNKYLLQCLDVEYGRLNDAAQDIMQKFEERAVYFLSVDCNLSEEAMKKMEEYGIADDMDGIMELTDSELIEIGIERPGMRKKILRNIMKLKQRN